MEKEFREQTVNVREDAVTLTNENWAVVQEAVSELGKVGFLSGYYDEVLSIARVSQFTLENLGYTYDEFMWATDGSLRKLFYGENQTFLKENRFRRLNGVGEAQVLTKDGAPVYVRLCKKDSVDANGEPMWIIGLQLDWMQQNLKLINNVYRSGMWYFDCDRNNNITNVFWSHEFRLLLGYHDIIDFPNEISSWVSLMHPDDMQRTFERLQETLLDKSDQIKFDVEYRMQMRDHSYQWFRTSAETSRRLDGSVRRIAGTFVNIDERKRSEMKMQRNEAYHRAYTKGNICEYYLDIEENTFDSLKVEDSLLGIFEKSTTWDELIQAYLDYFVVDEDKKAVATFYNRSYIAQKFDEGMREILLECRIRLGGEVHWVRNVVMRGEEAEDTRYAIIFVRDITEAKREMEERLELTRKNDEMDLMLKGTTRLVDRMAICNLDEDTYEFFNVNEQDTADEWRGSYSCFVSSTDLKYKLLTEDELPSEALAAETVRRRLRCPEDMYKTEYCTLDETVFKSLALIPLSWNERGELERMLLIAQNITPEKNLEIRSRIALKEAYDAANRANQAKTAFLSNMSHDIRTPMNAIVGMTAIASANIDNPDRVQDCLGKITQSSRHLLGLINEVLDMSRIESGRIELADEDFNLAELVDNMVTMTRGMVEAHHHKLYLQLGMITHEYVRGDSLRLQQVITNILGNAIKYTPDGGRITFSLTERPTQSAGVGCYEFTIEDNGIGMSEEFQKVLFEPFTRADHKRIGAVQGTGLGMAITRNIVSMMNGHIQVESAEGHGSRFVVTIYLRLQAQSAEKIEELLDLPVLVVDDDPIACESVVNLLNGIGVRGEWVTSGAEAIERAKERHARGEDYFAMIIDWQMPEMSGVETARRLRADIGDASAVFLLTAYDYSQVEDEARAVGVEDFITKPLFRSRLVAALQNLLEGKPAGNVQDYLADITSCDYSGRRILLVEDNELNREVAVEIIGMSGATVETAANGKEALDLVSAAPQDYYDLVFMDIQMPVMNGYEAATAIRALPKHKGERIPIVAMTANAFAEDVILAKSAGMNEHIAKPLDMEKLAMLLRRWLEK